MSDALESVLLLPVCTPGQRAQGVNHTSPMISVSIILSSASLLSSCLYVFVEILFLAGQGSGGGFLLVSSLAPFICAEYPRDLRLSLLTDLLEGI